MSEAGHNSRESSSSSTPVAHQQREASIFERPAQLLASLFGDSGEEKQLDDESAAEPLTQRLNDGVRIGWQPNPLAVPPGLRTPTPSRAPFKLNQSRKSEGKEDFESRCSSNERGLMTLLEPAHSKGDTSFLDSRKSLNDVAGAETPNNEVLDPATAGVNPLSRRPPPPPPDYDVSPGFSASRTFFRSLGIMLISSPSWRLSRSLLP
jgi:hypothetical protein